MKVPRESNSSQDSILQVLNSAAVVPLIPAEGVDVEYRGCEFLGLRVQRLCRRSKQHQCDQCRDSQPRSPGSYISVLQNSASLECLPLLYVFGLIYRILAHRRVRGPEILVRNTQTGEQRIDARRCCRIDGQRRREQPITAVVAQRLPFQATI